MDTRQRWNDDEPLPEGAFNDGPEYGNPLNLAILGLPPLRRYEETPPEEFHSLTKESHQEFMNKVQAHLEAMGGDPLWAFSSQMMQWLRSARASSRQYYRWQSIRKRQRRAAQRRHNKGNQRRK